LKQNVLTDGLDKPQTKTTGALQHKAYPLATGSETILLVEDDPQVRRVTAMVLRRYGYAVLEAESGHQALGICAGQDGAIHLLVTDLAMPHMTGLELVARVRHLAPGVRALCVSGYLDEDEPEDFPPSICEEIPVSDVAFLSKPFLPEELAQRVRHVLDGQSETSRMVVYDGECGET
jgi:two-component system cell cycle sensor histidine kinase/response regulator CckA